MLTTGTGSGKSLAYFIPIVDDMLRRRARDGRKAISAIVVYSMNALCSRTNRLTSSCLPSPAGHLGGGEAHGWVGASGLRVRVHLPASVFIES